MAEPPRPDSEPSASRSSDVDPVPYGDAGAHDEVSDDTLAEALAALFQTSEPDPEWAEWAPDPYPEAPLPVIEPPSDPWAASGFDAPEPDLRLADAAREPDAAREDVVPDLWLPDPALEAPVAEARPADLSLPPAGEVDDPLGPSTPDFELEPRADASTSALQEAGFTSPLHSALSELGRIIPDSGEGEEGEEPAGVPTVAAPAAEATGQGPRWPARASRGPSVAPLRERWASGWRERAPALVVAAVVVLAFAVVLATGPDDDDNKGIDAGRSTPSTAPPTTSAFVPEMTLPLEPPIDEGVPAVSSDGGAPAASALTPARGRSPRRPAAARTPAPAPATKPAAKAPAPAPPAPAPTPPANNPPVNNPPPHDPPDPPQTTPMTTDPTPTTLRDPCDLIRDPERQARCREASS